MTETRENKHTPTPWHAHSGGRENDNHFVLAGADGKVVAEYGLGDRGDACGIAETAANMRLIVTAVNCHADLLDVAETFLSMHAAYMADDDSRYPDGLLANVRDLAEAAVRKVKGG